MKNQSEHSFASIATTDIFQRCPYNIFQTVRTTCCFHFFIVTLSINKCIICLNYVFEHSLEHPEKLIQQDVGEKSLLNSQSFQTKHEFSNAIVFCASVRHLTVSPI